MASLIADIGGTNARFSLLDNEKQLQQIEILPCQKFENLANAIDHYLQDKIQPVSACFAVAAPIMQDDVRFINNDWLFSINALKKRYQFKTLDVINDFDAIAYAIPSLGNQDIQQIGIQTPVTTGPISILGPGTGFGNALLLAETNTVISTQGGHSGFAPATELEEKLFCWAIKNTITISRENFISGPGMENLYTGLCEIKNQPCKPLTAIEISHIGLEKWRENKQHICADVLKMFFALLGSIAGDQALSSGATGGVYIAGGIAKRMIDFIEKSDFRVRFENKGLMSHYVNTIPTYIITAEQPGLIGASNYLYNK